jgi:hypothetical protein
MLTENDLQNYRKVSRVQSKRELRERLDKMDCSHSQIKLKKKFVAPPETDIAENFNVRLLNEKQD